MVDQKVAATLNDLHQRNAEVVNARRKDLKPLEVGSLVWYLRPRGRHREKLETYWLGPCPVLERVGNHSYVVELEPGRRQDAHRCQLKEHREDPIGPAVKLYEYRQAKEDNDMGHGEWILKRILGHKRGLNGDPIFHVQWDGSDQTTWEPLYNFFHRYNDTILDYMKTNNVTLDLIDYLHRHPPDDEAAVAAAMIDTSRKLRLEWEEPPQEWRWSDAKCHTDRVHHSPE